MRKRWIAVLFAAGAIGCASQAPPPSHSDATTPSPAALPPPSTGVADPAPSPAPEPPPGPARYLPSNDPSRSPFAGGDGTSPDEAVVVLAETEDEGIDLEHHWTFDHYGRFRKKAGALASANGRHFDVITVELSDHTEKTIYFDITAFYGVMEKPAAPPPP